MAGHANAILVGPNGLVASRHLLIGVSLMAPNTVYPDHRHPPAEGYVMLSQGWWRQEQGPWKTPGTGGWVYNPPDILHAMRSGPQPLLAVWCLPLD
jgi:quercetin dioxygenase-like cupin family protein